MESHVYLITHEPSRRHYVGKTNDLIKREVAHRRLGSNASRSRQYIHLAMKKYGSKHFRFQHLETFDTEAEAFEGESFWISFLRADVPGYGFNLNAGGRGGYKMSALLKAKVSAATVGKKRSAATCKKISAFMKARFLSGILPFADTRGRPLTEAHRQKLRERASRAPRSEETRRKISEAKFAYWAQRRAEGNCKLFKPRRRPQPKLKNQ